MRIIAVIPARGGSKGILRKNLREICGDPLVAIKIKQASLSLCTEVFVSTDDQEIKNVSIKYGAKIIHRPENLSTDEASTDDMLLHAVKDLNCIDQDIIVLLQPTSPLLNIDSINECINLLKNNITLSSVITIKEGHPFMWESKDKNYWNPSGHTRQLRPRRQDFDASGWETGGCYAIKVEALIKQKVRYPEPTGIVNVSFLESIDIDTCDDLNLAEQVSIMQQINSTKGLIINEK